MQVVIDELHLFLRIFDVLLRNLIWAAVAADASIYKDCTAHKDKLLKCIQECGVTFRV